MKLFIHLCGIVLFGLLGYSIEPNLRFQLTGMKPSKVETAGRQKVILRMGDGKGDIDIETLTPDQLPEKVMIKSNVTASDATTGITMNIPAGNLVKLIRIENGNVVVSPPEGNYQGKIPITDTDLLKQLSENPPNLGKPLPAPIPQPVAPEPVTPTKGESAEPPVVPEPPPVPEPSPAPEPAAPVEPIAPPEPITPEPPAAAGNAASVDLVKVMQDSVKSGLIKEFKFEQVSEWKAGEPEMVDGQSFATGTALYKAVTFLGEKTIEAKAFIKDGKVQRWIWPRSGMEIK